MDKNQVAKSFGKSVNTYDEAACLQYEVGSRLFERLDYLRLTPETVLDLGCGTGYLAAQLQAYYPDANLWLCDRSLSMIAYAKRYHIDSEKTFSFCADAAALPLPDHSVDLIFSNLMFQWCPDLPSVIRECRRILKSEGILLFSTLGPDSLNEVTQSWAAVDNHPHVLDFLDMHHVGDMLFHAGLQDPVVDCEPIYLHYETVQRLLNDLRSIGVRNVRSDRAKGLMGKRRFQKWIEAYEGLRDEQGLLPLTYDVIYGLAYSRGPASQI